MKKTLGFVIFWVAIGMLLMLFINGKIIGLLICIIFLVAGYNLFCC